MKNFDEEIRNDKEATEKIIDNDDKLAMLKNKLSTLSSSEFLDLIEHETSMRKRKRNEIRGGNDIEINKINMILKDEFWCTKIYVLIQSGQYNGFTQKIDEAERFVQGSIGREFKEEIVDLREMY